MVPPGEVGEFHSRGRRHDDIPRVRVVQRSPGACTAVGIVEERPVLVDHDLLAVPARHDGVVFAEEDGLRGRLSVEQFRQAARVELALGQAVDHARPVRRRHQRARDTAVGGLQLCRALDARLSVVRAEEDCVALEKLVRAAGRVEQCADCRVAPRERLERAVGTVRVRGEVVVG